MTKHSKFYYLFPQESGVYGGKKEFLAVTIAYRTATPGLIVHRAYKLGGWRVTHEGTGLHVFRTTSRRIGFLLAGSLRELEDWTQSREMLLKTPNVKLIKQIRSLWG